MVCFLTDVWDFVFFSLVLLLAVFPRHIPVYSWERQSIPEIGRGIQCETNFAMSNPYMDNPVHCHFPSSACTALEFICSFSSPFGTKLRFLSFQTAGAPLQEFTLVPCRVKRTMFLVTTLIVVILLCALDKVYGLSYHKGYIVCKCVTCIAPWDLKLNNKKTYISFKKFY